MNEISVIDIREKFGRRYKIHSEESNTRDPWLSKIVCQHGHIYPHGGEFLGAATNHRGKIAKTLKNLPCITVTQDGNDGINATFHVDDFGKVAKVMKPRLRRVLSEDHKRRLHEAGRSMRFEHGSGAAGGELKRPSAPKKRWDTPRTV
jgi:hypothetical protein